MHASKSFVCLPNHCFTNPTTPMKNDPASLAHGRMTIAALLFPLVFSVTSPAFAQTVVDDAKGKDAPSGQINSDKNQRTDPTHPEKATIVLDKFTVKATSDGHRYGPRKTNSAARIVQDYQSIAQAIVSLPKELIQDTAAYRLEDIIKFAAGATRGANANGDNFIVRGLSAVNTTSTVDGFVIPRSTDRDMFFYESIDVLKGPSAILLPTGQPGGAINYITKNPASTFGGYVRAQIGQYDANRVEFDITGPTQGGRIDYRFGAAYHDAEGFHDHAHRRKELFLGALTFHLSDNTDLTWKITSENFDGGVDLGFIITADGRNYPKTIPRNYSQEPDATYWTQDQLVTNLMLTTKLNSWLISRLALNYHDTKHQSIGNNGIYRYVGGIPAGTTVLTGGRANWVRNDGWGFSLQNDYVAYAKTGVLNHTITFGYSLENGESRVNNRDLANNVTDLNLANPTRPRLINTDITTWPYDGGNSARYGSAKQYRSYMMDSINFKDRLYLSGGFSWNKSEGTETLPAISADRLSILPTGTIINDVSSRPEWLVNYGVIYKIVPLVSLYYGHSELVNFNTQTFPDTGAKAPNSGAEQNEIGVKSILLGGKLQLSIAAYKITQQGSPAPDLVSRTFVFRPSRTAKGVDIDITYDVSKKLSLIAAYGHVNATTALGGRALGVPSDTFRAWTMFSAPGEVLKNFRFGLGMDHTSDRLGDLFTEIGRDGAPFFPAANPFLLKAYTTFDALVSYHRASSKIEYSVKFNNITNEKYFRQSTVPYAAVTAPDFNVIANVTYRF